MLSACKYHTPVITVLTLTSQVCWHPGHPVHQGQGTQPQHEQHCLQQPHGHLPEPRRGHGHRGQVLVPELHLQPAEVPQLPHPLLLLLLALPVLLSQLSWGAGWHPWPPLLQWRLAVISRGGEETEQERTMKQHLLSWYWLRRTAFVWKLDLTVNKSSKIHGFCHSYLFSKIILWFSIVYVCTIKYKHVDWVTGTHSFLWDTALTSMAPHVSYQQEETEKNVFCKQNTLSIRIVQHKANVESITRSHWITWGVSLINFEQDRTVNASFFVLLSFKGSIFSFCPSCPLLVNRGIRALISEENKSL